MRTSHRLRPEECFTFIGIRNRELARCNQVAVLIYQYVFRHRARDRARNKRSIIRARDRDRDRLRRTINRRHRHRVRQRGTNTKRLNRRLIVINLIRPRTCRIDR